MYKKILAVKLRAMGDTALWTASLTELKRQFPRADIDVVVDAVWAPLLENHPAIRKIIPHRIHDQRAARARAILRLALELRRERYDCVLGFHASPSISMLARMTGAKTRAIHFHGHHHSDRSSTVKIPGKGTVKPIIERDFDTIRSLGASIPEGEFETRVFLTDAEKQWAKAKKTEMHLKSPTLVVALGASRETKQWPTERFSEVVREFMAATGGSVLAVGGSIDRATANAFIAGIPEHLRGSVMVALQQPLRELAALFAGCDVFLGNDSGPKHLAVATGLPTVTVFGPEDPFEWHPYSDKRHAVHFIPGLSCRKDADPGQPAWCGIPVCMVENHRCMKDIRGEDVLQSVLRLKDAK